MEPRSSFWRGRPARELTRSEPLDVVSRLFKASLAGALTSFSFVALWCVRLCCAWCVAFADLPHTHTHTHTHAHTHRRWPVRAPTKVGGLAFERASARALSFADSSGGCLCWLERACTEWPRQLLFSGGELVFILLADFCREPSRLNVLKKNTRRWRARRIRKFKRQRI